MLSVVTVTLLECYVRIVTSGERKRQEDYFSGETLEEVVVKMAVEVVEVEVEVEVKRKRKPAYFKKARHGASQRMTDVRRGKERR